MIKNINQSLKNHLEPIIDENLPKKIIPGKDYISVTGKVIDKNDILAGVDATLSSWLTTGRNAKEFESTWLNTLDQDFFINKLGSSPNLVAFFIDILFIETRLLKEMKLLLNQVPTTINP